MSERITTMMSPPGLPRGFIWAVFVTQLTQLDLKIQTTIQEIDEALKQGNENRMHELITIKAQQRESLMNFLTNAYEQSNGKIAELPEFDPENERSFKLALLEEGEDLWELLSERVTRIREDQQRRMMQTLPTPDPDED